MKTRLTFLLCIISLLAAAPIAIGQGATTAGLNGRIIDTDNNPLAGATVVLTHLPTASRYEVVTQENGRFSLRSLRPEGPYNLEVRADFHTPKRNENLFLPLGQVVNLEVRMESSAERVVELESFEVAASPLSDYGLDTAGPVTTLSAGQISRLPTVERGLNDFARLNPFVNVSSDLSTGTAQISAAGQHNRFNSINIDGVNADDPFGLQDNGQPARGNLFALDAIEAITIELSSYNVRSAGYGGASINAVTRSGSNEFSGSLYTYYRNENMRGKKNTNGERQPLGDFTEKTWGLTFGGPILKDRLFFFVSYEEVRNETLPPIASFAPLDAEFAELQRIASLAGITPEQLGSVTAPSATMLTDDKLLAKVDWQINDMHRATVRYTFTEGEEPVYYNYTAATNTSTSSHWAVQKREYDTITGQLHSRWTPDLSTEFSISRAEYDSYFDNLSDLPQVSIHGLTNRYNPSVTDGSLFFGAEQFRHDNVLNTSSLNLSGHADYTLGNHTISFGVDYESSDVYNMFFRDSKGVYVFDNLAQFEQSLTTPGAMRSYALGYALPGTNPAAEYNTKDLGVYIQTEWSVSRNLTATIGLRLDTPIVSDEPQYNAAFEQTFGYRNDTTHDGNALIQPRIGMNWKSHDERTRIRGGLGLFYGKIPPVWFANSYSNTGNSRVTDVSRTDKLFTTNPQPPAGGTLPAAEINVMDPDFEIPSTWRSNLALERDVDFLGLTLNAELLYTQVNKGIAYYNDNLQVEQTLADGRRIFAATRFAEPDFRDVIILTNTDKGHSFNFALGATREGKEDGWEFSAYYVHGISKDVNAGTSSQALSTYQRTSYLNPPLSTDDFELTRSGFEIQHRFLVTLSKEIVWRKGYETNLALIYDCHSGRPFSWVFRNDINRDGQSGSHPNDLMYVPSDASDPLFGGMYGGDEDAFFAFINSRPELRDAKGSVISRNAGRDDWQHRFDLSITQNVHIWNNYHFEIFLTLQNVGNLIKSEWGAVRESSGFQRRSFASARINASGQYEYSMTPSDLDDGVERRIETRWSALFGARIRF